MAILPNLTSSVLDVKLTEYEEALVVASANDAPSISTPFWERPDEIDLSRWNDSRPYQLLVVEAKRTATGTSYVPVGGWGYTLPVPPEGYTLSTPFAITTTVTQGGIIEEHNAAPLRMIQLRGSTGVLPARGTAPQQGGFGLFQAIAGGTLQAGQAVSSALQGLASSALGTALSNPNSHDPSEFQGTEKSGTLLSKTTGYCQRLKLQEFLEKYAQIRTTKAGRNLRLALAVWKDQEVYVVTPKGLEWPRTAASPLEYPYVLTLLAWRRVRLEQSGFTAVLPQPVRRDPNALARLVTTLDRARAVVQGTSKAAAAAVGDISRLINEPLREAVLFAKDLGGAAQTLADLPDALKQAASEAYVRAMGTNSGAATVATTTNPLVKSQQQAARRTANLAADLTSQTLKRQGATAVTVAVSSAPFQAPQFNQALFATIPLSGLELPPALTAQIQAERSRVRLLRRVDFESRRDSVRAAADRLAFALACGDPTYAATYGVTTQPIKAAPTDADHEALYALNEAAMALDSLAATGDNEPTSREASIEVMAALNRRAGIAFQVPVSKFAVPFRYGDTLETLAAAYLGDADRWPEIAALNGLKPPYVDEVGYDVPLVVNGSGNEVVVATSDAVARGLYIGQTVYVASTFRSRTTRKIQALRTVGVQTAVTLDGDSDMADYQVQHAAVLSAFAPDTTNSQQLIYIPSPDAAAEESFTTKAIPGVDTFDPMVQAGGVDLLLDNGLDLVMTPDGDARLAIGLTNIVQGVNILTAVEQGTLMDHPTFGIAVRVGANTADIDPKQVVDAIRRAIQNDPTFSGVSAIQVLKQGGATRTNVTLAVSGTSQLVPVSFAVN